MAHTVKARPFKWTTEAEEAFKLMKLRLTIALVLSLLDFLQPFELHYEASKMGIGAVLSQNNKPVAYFSDNCLVQNCVIVLTMWSSMQLYRQSSIGITIFFNKSLYFSLIMMH